MGRIMAGLLLIISNVNNQHMQAVNNILAKTTVSQAPGFFFLVKLIFFAVVEVH